MRQRVLAVIEDDSKDLLEIRVRSARLLCCRQRACPRAASMCSGHIIKLRAQRHCAGNTSCCWVCHWSKRSQHSSNLREEWSQHSGEFHDVTCVRKQIRHSLLSGQAACACFPKSIDVALPQRLGQRRPCELAECMRAHNMSKSHRHTHCSMHSCVDTVNTWFGLH